ncbi:MAG: hypothetical protein ACJARS_001305 [bacterium]|jgi:hypothetical protein
MSGSLYELLRRCHRVELEALAGHLKIREQDLGLSKLARRIDQRLRQMGGHGIINVFTRGGEGPPWADIISRLCRKVGTPSNNDVEAMERALMEHWVITTWSTLTAQQQDRAWDELGLPRPTSDDGEPAADIHHAPTAQLMALFGDINPVFALPFLPFLGPIGALLYVGRPRDDQLMPAVLEVARLRQLARHRITIGVVGSPSCGKDAAIRALFGIDSGNIDPVAGSTSTVAITKLPGASALYIVNTPGLGDVIEAVTEEARQVLDLVDVYLYVVNAQGGVQTREKADYDDVVCRGRPVLAVINKIDTLRESDRARYLADARSKLGAPEDAFLAAAFDPLPALSELPLGIAPIRAWICDQLQMLGKDESELNALK